MTVDLTQLKQSLLYQTTAPIPQVVTDLKQVMAFDQQIEQTQRRWTMAMTACIVGALGVFILGMILVDNSAIAPLLFILLVPLILGAIITGWQRSKYVNINIPNYRYRVVPKLLAMMMRDMEKPGTVRIHLGLSPPIRSEKCTFSGPHPQRQGWKLERFQDVWLTLEGQFLDNTRFGLTCTDVWVRQSGWKRGRSGKNKHKTKTKPKGFLLELTLTAPRKKYGALPVLSQEATGAVQLPPNCTLKGLKVTDNRLSLEVKAALFATDAAVLSEELYKITTMMFLSLYQVLNLARVLSTDKAEARGDRP